MNPLTGIEWCEGRVMHARVGQAAHRFIYPLAYVRASVDVLDGPAQRRWGGLFALGCAGLFSLRREDHGARDDSALRPWLQAQLQLTGTALELGKVTLQTMPRVLGYVFNPVSFWYCHDREGVLRAVLCEVNNTFGESHNYVVRHDDGRALRRGEVMEAAKVFHVSPFFPVQGRYRFRFLGAAHRHGVQIEYRRDDAPALLAHVAGSAQPLRAGLLLRALWRYPLMTLGVMVRIHWQALHLWRKGAVFHRKPIPPLEHTT